MFLRRRRALALAAVLLVIVLPACSRKKKKAAPAPAPVTSSAAAASSSSPAALSASPSATPSPTPTPSPSPSPTSSPRPAVAQGHPFTGGAEPLGPVVAVKIDNTGPGFPQIGLADADLIYQELVEAGETRLCAIYSTKKPALVGPIRSARETDIELLASYGKVSLAFSGANKIMLGVVRRANLVDARWDAVPSAYTELRSRRQPFRVHASVPKIIAGAGGANAKDIGLRFGNSRAPSSPATNVTVRWQYATNTAKYDPATRRWTIALGGRRQVTVDNLVVQYVKIKQTGFTDSLGNHTPLSRTLGSGKLTVFRDGRAVDGSWHRQFMKDPTVMLDSKRQRMMLRPGTTFVMLLPNTLSVSAS